MVHDTAFMLPTQAANPLVFLVTMNHQKIIMLLKHQRFYISSFIETFLLEKRRILWSDTLLKMDTLYWNKVSAWDLWDENYSIVEYCKEWNGNLRTLLETPFIKRYKNTIVLIIYVGHDNGRIEYRMLHEILLKEVFILEGIVIIEPYCLALAINHDGDICVCQKQA